MSGTFAEFKVKKNESVIFVSVNGSIDIESMQTCIDKVEEIIPSIKAPWAALVDLSNWKLYTPDVVRVIGDFENRMIGLGFSAEVSVIDKSKLKESAREQLFNQTNVLVKRIYVNTIDEGWDWMIQEGFCNQRPYEKN